VENSKMPILQMLLQLHGGVFLISVAWLAKRHNHWALRWPVRRSATPGGAA